MGQPAAGTLPATHSNGLSSRLTAGATRQVVERLWPLITWVTWPPWCRAALGVPCVASGTRTCHRDGHRHLIFNQVRSDDGWWICRSQIGRCWVGGGKTSKCRSDGPYWRPPISFSCCFNISPVIFPHQCVSHSVRDSFSWKDILWGHLTAHVVSFNHQTCKKKINYPDLCTKKQLYMKSVSAPGPSTEFGQFCLFLSLCNP